MEKQIKMVRLRDLVFYHCKKLKGDKCTCGEMNDLEADIKVYIKNLLHALDDIDAKASIMWLGDNDSKKEAIATD